MLNRGAGVRRWQRTAVAVWAVLVVGGGAVTLLLGDGREEPPAGRPGSAPSGSSPVADCKRPNVLCAARIETAPAGASAGVPGVPGGHGR
ncbi:hypothetical protein [Kitasatospora sp. NPDC093806]|uniref:hypothetical protein n=1 Tax=Kitasatospora sp. NPDC093806 TaxID=3155075 RepID=UPI00341D978B